MEDGSTLVCRYDAEGLRHETEENGRLVRFIYSGRDAVCEEREEGGSIRYIREHGRLAASDCEQARTYYHYACDSLGSVLYVLAGNEYESPENGGTLQERVLCSYTYDAFGRERSAAEQTENRYRYTGEQYDAITGQYYLWARYYRPETGRFTQMDPYHGDGLNLYVYAGNNPVRYVDPSGHEKEEVCKDNGMGGTDGSESGKKTPEQVCSFGNRTQPRGARPKQDFGVADFDDIVGPETGKFPKGASNVTDINNAPLSGHYHVLLEGTVLPNGLGIKADGSNVFPDSPHGVGHYTIFPTKEMTVMEFNELYKSLPWNYGGKK